MTVSDTADLKDIEGLVLREFKYKESSKIMEIFTRDLGRISVIARGVLNKNSTNLGLSQRFVLADFSFFRSGKNFYGLKDGSIKKSYFKNKDFDIILYMSAMADLLLRTIDDGQRDGVYRLLINSFEALDRAGGGEINIFLAFFIKYVSFSGFRPNFKTCGICGKKIRGRDLYFSVRESSLVCEDCKHLAEDKTYLRPEEYVYFNKLLYTPSDELSQIKLIPTYKKIGLLIINYCLKSLDLSRYSSIDWVIKALERNMNVL